MTSASSLCYYKYRHVYTYTAITKVLPKPHDVLLARKQTTNAAVSVMLMDIRLTAKEATAFLFDSAELLDSSGESDIEEDPSFPLPNVDDDDEACWNTETATDNLEPLPPATIPAYLSSEVYTFGPLLWLAQPMHHFMWTPATANEKTTN